MTMRVLIVEDNHSVAQTINLALAKKLGIISDITDLGEEVIEINKLNSYDLIILDIALPDINGLEILKELRTTKKRVPVLILSGYGSSEDKIKGLGLGADDYLSKPFNIDELLARVQAIIRRAKGHPDSIIEICDLKINFEKHTTTMLDKTMHLTTTEQSIIELLALKKGQIVNKEHFLNHLYNGNDDEPEPKIIDVFVCKLRKKLFEASGGFNYIETSWGRGYVLKHPDESQVSHIEKPAPNSDSTLPSATFHNSITIDKKSIRKRM